MENLLKNKATYLKHVFINYDLPERELYNDAKIIEQNLEKIIKDSNIPYNDFK